jgi:TRAP-type transport system small permease protein
LIKRLRKIESWLVIVAAVLLFIMMLVGSSDVIGRYLFNKPIPYAVEYEKILMLLIVVFGWAFLQSKFIGGQIKVELVVSRLKPRAQIVIRFINMFISLGLFALIAWQSLVVGMQIMDQHRVILGLQLPSFYLYFAVCFGACFACFESIFQLLNYFIKDKTEAKA